MKHNLGEKIFESNYGKNDEGHFSSIFSNTTQRTLSCYCKKCNSHLGNFTFTENSFVKMQSENIDKHILEDIIKASTTIGTNSFKAYCSQCGKTQTHYMVDVGMGSLIQNLNKLGLKTRFSCESHEINRSSGVYLPYIAFKENVSEYFDMSNPLLRMWIMEVYENGEVYKAKSILRVSPHVTIEDLMNDTCIDELEKYVALILYPKIRGSLPSQISKNKEQKEVNPIDHLSHGIPDDLIGKYYRDIDQLMNYFASTGMKNKGPSLKELGQKYFPNAINVSGHSDSETEEVEKKLRHIALKTYIEAGIPPEMMGFTEQEIQELKNSEKDNNEGDE
jgi:hypothetical protein